MSAMLVVGCNVGPKYKAPQPAVESSYDAAAPAAATQPSDLTPPDARWWKQLNDPILDSLIEQAAKCNYNVRLAAARIKEARAYMTIAGAEECPTINADASYSHQRYSRTAAPFNAFSIPNFPWEFNQYQAGFDASWELDVWGRARRGAEAAMADWQASIDGRRAAVLTVIAEVARNYTQLRGYQRQYQIAEDNLRTQKETLELTIDRRQHGVATQLDVVRASAQVNSTEATLPRLNSSQWAAMHRLAILLGKQPSELVDMLKDTQPIPTPPAEVTTGVPAELLRRRPDIRQAERQLAAATARVGEATADLYPRFSLTGSFSWTSEKTENLFSKNSRMFNIMPGVTWPIFDAGRLRAFVRVRDAEQEEALDTYEQTVIQALGEVHDAMDSFRTEQDRRQSLAKAVRDNQEAVDLAHDLYRQGLADFLTVLDAQRNLLLSQDALSQSDTVVTTSLVALYKALGGGWEMFEPCDDKSAGTPAGQPAAAPANEKAEASADAGNQQKRSDE